MDNLIDRLAWQRLKNHYQLINPQHIKDWFANDPKRFERFSIAWENLLFDYSKNRITDETIELLCQLANECGLKNKIDALFAGSPVNTTENRPAMHMALRDPNSPFAEVKAARAKLSAFVDKIHRDEWVGATGKPIRHIINIGIGGSHLGPFMTTQALKKFAIPSLQCHFISNIDSDHLQEVFRKIDPETSLFIVSSKSFSTSETLMNANTARQWLQAKLNLTDVSSHFVAITADEMKAKKFGIDERNVFPVWDWVGGRYSIWSSIGLPLALMIGMENFSEFLAGAHAMDVHFQTQPFAQNIPVLMGLLGIWYINFFDAEHHAIIPYSHHLNYFRNYIQQSDMESNGKTTDLNGNALHYRTGPIIIGEQGCEGQHSVHQLFHQGSHFVPIDFILVAENDEEEFDHQDMLVASGLSQASALMRGKTYEQAYTELQKLGLAPEEIQNLAQHKVIPGNKPNNVLFFEKLTPKSLGSLIAIYEHKIFVQGAIWNINSFDQWGVELGKQLLPNILFDLQNASTGIEHDASTLGLINFYKQTQKFDLAQTEVPAETVPE